MYRECDIKAEFADGCRGIVINDKEKESFVNEPRDDKSNDSGSGHRRKDGKKKKTRRIKEIIYYDDSDESTSSQKDGDNDYKKTVSNLVTLNQVRLITEGLPSICVISESPKSTSCPNSLPTTSSG